MQLTEATFLVVTPTQVDNNSVYDYDDDTTI